MALVTMALVTGTAHSWVAHSPQSPEKHALCRYCGRIMSKDDYRVLGPVMDCPGDLRFADKAPAAPETSRTKPRSTPDEIRAITHEIAGRAHR